MKLRKSSSLAVVMLLVATASATFNYDYGADEYVTISRGTSPNGRLAVTAHGRGELGYDDFHLYLFDAVAGKKIGPLEEIRDVLDTGAGAYVAKWKPDSSEVAIIYRVSRHAPLKVMAYRLARGRAYPLTRQPANLRDNDPLKQYMVEFDDDPHLTERTFGTPK